MSSKDIGFEVYKIRKFICAEFELSFHLFNEASLSSAHSSSSGLPVYPWIEVSKKSSYDEVVKKPEVIPPSAKQFLVKGPAVLLTRANRVLVQALPARQNAAPRVHDKSVFDRLTFPRVSVFDRLSWDSVSPEKRLIPPKHSFQARSSSSLDK